MGIGNVFRDDRLASKEVMAECISDMSDLLGGLSPEGAAALEVWFDDLRYHGYTMPGHATCFIGNDETLVITGSADVIETLGKYPKSYKLVAVLPWHAYPTNHEFAYPTIDYQDTIDGINAICRRVMHINDPH